MKKKLLFLLLSLLMSASAFAECKLYIDDFAVMPYQIGQEIELCVKATFSARLDTWQLDLTYPEGMTPTHAELGVDGPIIYTNALGSTAICNPYFYHAADYTRLIAMSQEYGYWYDNNDDLTSYGTVKWEAGEYEEMILLYVEVSQDFHGGEIILSTTCSSSIDARGGTIRENGDNGVAFMSTCNVSVAPEAYACYTPSNTTLTFYYDKLRHTRPGTTYDLNTGNNKPGWYSDRIYSSVTRVVFDPSFADARPTSTCGWFFLMQNLQPITGLNYLNTSDVTCMMEMFGGCTQFTTLDLSSFNTSKVTSMRGMFDYCIGLTSINLSNFDTSNVTDMSNMFVNCSNLTSIDVTHFNTANVTDMSSMFSHCLELTEIDVSHFNTANVTGMAYMFYSSSGLTTLDLSSFNTAKVTEMAYMFNDCSDLRTVYVSNGWTTAAVTYSPNMFNGCTSLVGGQGTTYNSSNPTDKTYAHIDGGTSNPGYFTAKPAGIRGDVNGDQAVNMDDLTALINYLLTGNNAGINMANAASCDSPSSTTVSMDDLTALINFLLTNHW